MNIDQIRLEMISKISMKKPLGKISSKGTLMDLIEDGIDIQPKPSEFYFEIEDWLTDNSVVLIMGDMEDPEGEHLTWEININEIDLDLLIKIYQLI